MLLSIKLTIRLFRTSSSYCGWSECRVFALSHQSDKTWVTRVLGGISDLRVSNQKEMQSQKKHPLSTGFVITYISGTPACLSGRWISFVSETQVHIGKHPDPCRLVRQVNKSWGRTAKTFAPARQAGGGTVGHRISRSQNSGTCRSRRQGADHVGPRDVGKDKPKEGLGVLPRSN